MSTLLPNPCSSTTSLPIQNKNIEHNTYGIIREDQFHSHCGFPCGKWWWEITIVSSYDMKRLKPCRLLVTIA